VIPALLLAVSAAHAQGQPPTTGRPFRGLFGGSDTSGTQGGGLDLTASMQGAYDDDVTGRSGTSPSAATQPTIGGFSSGVGIAVAYDRPGDRLSVVADGRTDAVYLPSLDDLSGMSHAGTVAVTMRRGRLAVELSQAAGKTPFYSFSFAPTGPQAEEVLPNPLLGLDVIRRDSSYYRSQANVTQQLTTRTSISGSVAWRRSDYAEGQNDITHRSASLRLSRNFSRYLSIGAGYGHQEGRYSNPAQVFTTHDINIGADYDRPLSRSRRTFISLSTGSTVLEDQRGRSFRAVGSAGLRRLIGRTWTAEVNYERSARYVDGFASPFFADGVSGTVAGFVSRRVDTAATWGYSKGVAGFSGDAPAYDTFQASANVRVALTRLTALQANYLYYHYAFEPNLEITGIPGTLTRHGARVGVTLWLPLLR
jgi:hypothetical protein